MNKKLSDEAAEKYDRIRPYGFFILIGLLLLGVFKIILKPIYAIIQILVLS